MTIHALVEGRVQGVGFRWFVRERARRLGLAGWVRNRPDGTVELAARGEDECVAMLRDFLRRGPDGAHVTAVRELPVENLSDLAEPFAILR